MSLRVEHRGFERVPASERTMTLPETAWFWLGTNANLFFVSVGALALGFGLGVWQALVAVLAGTLLFAVVGLASVAGVRSGLPTLTFTRAVFGPRGNLPHALLAWLTSVAFEAINCLFGVFALLALAEQLGWEDPGAAGKVAATALVLGASAAIAVWGHATMVYLQRAFAIALTAVLLGVLVLALDDVQWSARTTLTPAETVAAMLAAGAVVASGPVSYLYNAPDWVRYLPERTASARVIWTVFAAGGAIALVLAALGVLLASRVDMSDPVAGVEPLVPGWLYVLFLLSAAGGAVANNAPTFYSSGLCLQALGLPLRRRAATALDVVLAAAMVLYILFVRDFTTTLQDFVALMVVWLAPFGAVWITHGSLHRWRYDATEIHDTQRRPLIDTGAWVAVAAGVAVCGLTINAPSFQGPLSRGLAGADLSWLAGPAVAAAAYWVVFQRRRSSRARATADARVSASSLR